MWYTERRYRHPTDSRKERHNEEERVFGRRGFAEYQLGGVPEDHEKSGRKAEKREKAEIVQTAPFGCAEGGSGCRKSLPLRASPQTGVAICYLRRGSSRGQSPPRIKIKCRAKPCLARRAWSEATIFVPQGGTKIGTLFQAVEKSRRLFRQPEKDGASRPFAVCKREIALLLAVLAAYLWAGGDVMSIGNQIMVIRREQQLTQEQFGNLFHVTRQTVSNWENGVSHS